MKEYSKGIYVKFKPEEVEILHNRMKEAGVHHFSSFTRTGHALVAKKAVIQ